MCFCTSAKNNWNLKSEKPTTKTSLIHAISKMKNGINLTKTCVISVFGKL